ncbi:MAG: autotransporter domain-containing protein, partial [Rubrivivax sp.]
NTPLAGTAAVFRYVPPRDGFGTESFGITVAADGGAQTTATVTVTVQPAAPSSNSLAMTVPLNTPTTLDLKAFIGGSEITGVRLSQAPAHGQTSIAGTVVTYAPRHDYFGTDQFAYSAFGVLGESTTAVIAVQVVGRPDPSKDPDVAGLAAAQSGMAQRFAWSQVENVQRRLDRLHRSSPPAAASPVDTPPPANAPPPSTAFAAPPLRAAAKAPSALDGLLLLAQSTQGVAQSGSIDLGAAARLGTPALGGGRAESGVWVGGKVELGQRGASAEQSGLRLHTDGVTVGYDRRISERLALGIGIGHARERVEIGTLGSEHRGRGESLALYGSWQGAPKVFVDGLLGYGRLRMDSRRIVEPIDDVALGQRRARLWFGALTLGYEHARAPWLFAPYGRFEFTQARLRESLESGGGAYALRWLEQRNNQQRLALGLRVEAAQETSFGAVTPWLRAEFQHELKGTPSARVAYADQPDGPFYDVQATAGDRHALQLTTGVELRSADGLALGLEVQTTRASGQPRSQALRLQLSKSWGGDLVGTLPSLASAPGQPFDLQFETGLVWDDNITRGKDAQDRLSDVVWRVMASRDKVVEINRRTQAVVRLGLGAEAPRRVPALGRAMVELRGELRYRGAGDFLAPTYSLSADAAYDDYRSALRDGARFGLDVLVRWPLTDRIEAGAGAAHNQRRGRSEVFHLADNSLRMSLDYRLGERGILYGAVEWRDGDHVSSGRTSLENLNLAEVFVDDDAFAGRNFQSYRFAARTGLLRLGANWQLGSASSLDLSWSRAGATPRERLSALSTPHYFANQVSLLILARY